MSTFYEEAAMAHGAGNPKWAVTFIENISGEERTEQVRASTYQQAINKGTDCLTRDFSKPLGAYYFKRCVRVAPASSDKIAGAVGMV